jgi:hypothetical protein
MKTLMIALFFTLAIPFSAQAGTGVDVYGELVIEKGYLSFRSLEKDTFGAEVVLDDSTLELFDPECDKGLFTLVQSLRKDRSFQVVDVVCETLTSAGF